ncbi:TRI39 ligase, partial [Emberiza fucata]|nr:TRI39 ligase [Emberiza fucata]
RPLEQVTLDPETAHPHLMLLDNNKMVWFTSEEQKLPDTPKRFTSSCCVLGSQGFTSGRHYWEVEVGTWGFWAVGVALESMPRKEWLNLLFCEKVWVLQLGFCGQYTAEHISTRPLALKVKLQRIRVCLDYEMGQVTIYNAKDMTQIVQLEATFTEKVFPYFSVCSEDTHIRVC